MKITFTGAFNLITPEETKLNSVLGPDYLLKNVFLI